MSPPPASVKAPTPSKRAEEPSWRPLREVIQKYSKTTGNQVRIKDEEIFDQLYSVNDLSWLEDFNRIEIFNEQSGKKEILLLDNHHWQHFARSNLKTGTARIQAKTALSLSLSREKLQKLNQGTPWSPLSANLYEDSEYRQFFAHFGVTAPQDLRDRKYTRKIRKAARRLLQQMQAE